MNGLKIIGWRHQVFEKPAFNIIGVFSLAAALLFWSRCCSIDLVQLDYKVEKARQGASHPGTFYLKAIGACLMAEYSFLWRVFWSFEIASHLATTKLLL